MQQTSLFLCLSKLTNTSAENDPPLKQEPQEQSVMKDQVEHLGLSRIIIFC